MLDYDLVGKDNSSDLRALLGAELGIGYSNGKQFMAKLNRYGVSLEEFKKAYEKINKDVYKRQALFSLALPLYDHHE